MGNIKRLPRTSWIRLTEGPPMLIQNSQPLSPVHAMLQDCTHSLLHTKHFRVLRLTPTESQPERRVRLVYRGACAGWPSETSFHVSRVHSAVAASCMKCGGCRQTSPGEHCKFSLMAHDRQHRAQREVLLAAGCSRYAAGAKRQVMG